MKLGIAGSGKIVQEVLPVLTQLSIPLKGIWSRKHSQKRLASLSKTYGISKYYTDYDEMLDNGDIDTIYVATPNAQHYEFCRKAILKKKHVICEKAFTANYQEAEELFRLAEEHNVLLIEAITNQYQPLFHQLKELLAQDTIGRLRIVSANYSQYSSRYDSFREGVILPAFDVHCAGGALMDINIYNLHFMTGLFGRPIALHYQANIEHAIDTSGILTLVYPDFVCTCIGSKDCESRYYAELQGCEGVISLRTPASTCEGFDIYERKNKKTRHVEGPKQHRMLAEFEEFLRMIDTMDIESVNKAREHTLLVMELVDQAKKDAGLIFPADKC